MNPKLVNKKALALLFTTAIMFFIVGTAVALGLIMGFSALVIAISCVVLTLAFLIGFLPGLRKLLRRQ